MTRKFFALMLVLIPLSIGSAHAEFVLSPLSTFGTNGFLSSGQSFLGTANNARGLAYNSATDRLYVPNRNAVPSSPNVQILDGSTGAAPSIGPTALNVAGVTGGAFAVNHLDLADDGTIYLGNLSTSVGTADTNVYKIYRWAAGNESAAPTLAFSNIIPSVLGTRLGDTFAVTGSAASTRIVAAGGTASNQSVLFTTANGTDFSTTGPNTVVGAANGQLRLGIDFVDTSSFIAKANTAFFSLANVNGSNLLSLTSTNSTILAAEGPMAFYAPDNLLASIEASTTASGTIGNLVKLYKYDPSVVGGARLTLLSSLNLTGTGSGSTPGGLLTTANGNASGDLAFGLTSGGDLRLYAMSTNNGIQAFRITVVPEPSSIALVALCVVGIAARRRQLANRKQVS